jgi:hypothetical protein
MIGVTVQSRVWTWCLLIACVAGQRPVTDANAAYHRTAPSLRRRTPSGVTGRSRSQQVQIRRSLAHPTRFERVTFAFGGQLFVVAGNCSCLRWVIFPQQNNDFLLLSLELER